MFYKANRPKLHDLNDFFTSNLICITLLNCFEIELNMFKIITYFCYYQQNNRKMCFL